MTKLTKEPVPGWKSGTERRSDRKLELGEWCLRFHPAELELICARYRFNLKFVPAVSRAHHTHHGTTSRAKAAAANAATAALKTVPESQVFDEFVSALRC